MSSPRRSPRSSATALAALAVLAFASAAPRAQDAQTVDALLGKLTLEQKCGQLFVPWSLTRAQGQQKKRAELLAAVRDLGLGGVILSLGSVEEAAAFVPELQAAAARSAAGVPLLLAGDFEGGVAFRLDGATDLGNQMLVGASGLARLARAMGEVTGAEARALGFHWAFAPVLDVNVNPDNPIVNVRSFGEDPELVGKLGAAFAAGVRSANVLPCGKHFPGHGDVAVDSHLSLPTVPGDAARLRGVELLPFRVAARDGLETVMTGHLAVPGLGEDPAVPATLSKTILGDVLRGELGFTGLVVTDALDMGALGGGGVKGAFPPAEVAVRALLAGADVLLMPPDPRAARDAVAAAVREGRVPAARLDDAVRRILEAKARVGLLGGARDGPRKNGGVAANWREVVGCAAHRAVADEVAQRGVTVVFDRAGSVPLQKAEPWLLVQLLDQRARGGDFAQDADDARGVRFAAELQNGGVTLAGEVRLHGKSEPEAIAAAAAAIYGAQQVVLALHVKVRSYSGAIGLPPAFAPVLAALRDAQRIAAVSFGNPYLARNVDHLDAYVCAFAGSEACERAVAAVLAGAAPATGRLPVTIPGVAARGEGRTVLPGSELPAAEPEVEGVDPRLADDLRELLRRGVADRAFPGAVCAVARRGRVVAVVAEGRETYEDDAPAVRADTPYDLASLTKVCATLPAALRLHAQGKWSLDDPVAKWLPAFAGTGKERVTLRHLLAHCAGLPAYERYYRTLRGRDAIVAAAAAEGLMTEPGARTTYSDLGFVLLGAAIEACAQAPLAEVVRREVWEPLAMRGARWAPVDGEPVAAPPTEDDAARGGSVRGFVHDENAFAMGGVSGHAGMFATADDVLRLGVAFLAGGRALVPRPIAELALRPAGLVAGTAAEDPRGGGRALGFDLLQARSWAGTAVPAGAFGHTGFTGTSLWCDPRSDTCVALLTNRVHPTRVNDQITAVRRAVHDRVQAAVR